MSQFSGTQSVPKTEISGAILNFVINYQEKTTFTVQVSEHILVLGTICVPRVYLKLVKKLRSVPKSGGTTHGYDLGTLCVPNNMQGNYLSTLLGSNLSELKRLRRSSLTFFLEDFHHDAIHLLSSTTLYSIATIVDNKLLQTRHSDIISYDIQRDLYYQLPQLLRNVYFYLPIKKLIAVDASRDLLHL